MTTAPTLRILSLGAGVQSTTLALMACDGTLPGLDGAIFADTGGSMSEFSRRVNVKIIKARPLTFDEWNTLHPGWDVDDLKYAYAQYLDRFQPYRWRAVAANNEPIAHGESYFNEADCINAIELLFADDTTVYMAPTYGEDRGFTWLRYGATDRASRAAREATS